MGEKTFIVIAEKQRVHRIAHARIRCRITLFTRSLVLFEAKFSTGIFRKRLKALKELLNG